MFNVPSIQPDFIIKIEIGTSGDLRQSGDARLHGQYAAVMRFIDCDFFGQMRTWTDETHVAAQHQEELGEFIQ